MIFPKTLILFSSQIANHETFLPILVTTEENKKYHDVRRISYRSEILSPQVTPNGNNALVATWSWRNSKLVNRIKRTRIYYYTERYSKPRIVSPNLGSNQKWTVNRATSDTSYRVCIRVEKQQEMEGWPADIVCRKSSPQPWHMPASIGSSVGALLALIVIIFVMATVQRKHRHRRHNSARGPTSKRSRIDSALESQFDSVAYREETSFYDDATTIYDSTCAPTSSMADGGGGIASSPEAAEETDAAGPLAAHADTAMPLLPPKPNVNTSSSSNGHGASNKSVTFKEGTSKGQETGDTTPTVRETAIDEKGPLENSSGTEGTPGSGALFTQLIETI